jgi:hypothetical protein
VKFVSQENARQESKGEADLCFVKQDPDRTNIISIPYAASESDCSLTFDYGNPWLSNGGDHTGVSRWRHGSAFSIVVEGRRIEPLIRARFGDRLGRLRYIKTDAEGHDLSVLRSLEGLIGEFHPYIKSAVGKYASDEDRIAMHRLLASHNYTIRLVMNCNLFGMVLAEEDILKSKSINIFAVPN